MNEIALYHGEPVREKMLPYCQHHIEEDDIHAVVEVLKHGWLTNGPKVREFEEQFAGKFGVNHALSFSSGTSALLAAIHALNIGPGDEVIVPALTFAASVNCILSRGATPIFCDVDPDTLLISTRHVLELISERTKAILAVDYAGQPCDYDKLNEIADGHGLFLISDASHSLGGAYQDKPVGSLAHITTFSFHPTKNITTGEGGMITTNVDTVLSRARLFRSHGISRDAEQAAIHGDWHYEMIELGYNHRLSDLNCALGITQLNKLEKWVAERNTISQAYRKGLQDIDGFIPLYEKENIRHAYHLFVVKIDPQKVPVSRAMVFNALRAEGIGVNVHYTPVHLHPFYKRNYGTHQGQCLVAEEASTHILTLPMFPQMSGKDVEDVLQALSKVGQYFARSV